MSQSIPKLVKPISTKIKLGGQIYTIGKTLKPINGSAGKDLLKEIEKAGKAKSFPALDLYV